MIKDVLKVLEARRDVYKVKASRAFGEESSAPIYDRWDHFNHTREALDIAINEVRKVAGLPPLEIEGLD